MNSTMFIDTAKQYTVYVLTPANYPHVCGASCNAPAHTCAIRLLAQGGDFLRNKPALNVTIKTPYYYDETSQ